MELASHNLTRTLKIIEGRVTPAICISTSGTQDTRISIHHLTSASLQPQQLKQTRYTFKAECYRIGPVWREDAGKLAIVASDCFGSAQLVLELIILLPYACTIICYTLSNSYIIIIVIYRQYESRQNDDSFSLKNANN